MPVGDLVRYRGWRDDSGPLGIILEEVSPDSRFHHRIRVLWLGEEIPIQAHALSTTASRVTTWVSPKYFEIIESKG